MASLGEATLWLCDGIERGHFDGKDCEHAFDLAKRCRVATLRLMRPRLPDGFPNDPPPTIRMRILRSANMGRTEIASGTDAMLETTVTEPGAYRAEVWIVPEHTRPYLGREADSMIRDVPWVYSSPIHVE